MKIPSQGYFEKYNLKGKSELGVYVWGLRYLFQKQLLVSVLGLRGFNKY